MQKTLDRYHLSGKTVYGILLSPLLLLGLVHYGATQTKWRRMLGETTVENGPIELATFLLLLWGAWQAIRLLRDLPPHNYRRLSQVFYGLFAFGLFVVAMEEIAWGQTYLQFKTPEALRAVNMQGQTTLHNIKGLHGDNELLIMAFGIGGLAGIAIALLPACGLIHSAWFMVSWYLVLIVDSIIDFQGQTSYYINGISEIAELMLAVCALLYIGLNRKRILGKSEPATAKED